MSSIFAATTVSSGAASHHTDLKPELDKNVLAYLTNKYIYDLIIEIQTTNKSLPPLLDPATIKQATQPSVKDDLMQSFNGNMTVSAPVASIGAPKPAKVGIEAEKELVEEMRELVRTRLERINEVFDKETQLDENLMDNRWLFEAF